MKKTMQLRRFVAMVKLIAMLAIPTLLCGVIVSFKTAFQIWTLILAFLFPFFSGLLIIFNNVWKNRTLAFFFQAVVIGISFFTTSVVGMAMDVFGLRELLPFFITATLGITIDSHATGLRQVVFTSAIVGFIVFVGVVFFTLFSQLIRRVIKEVVKDVMREVVKEQ